MNKLIHQRGAQGKHAAETAKLTQQVMDLFHINAAIIVLPVVNYHRMPEENKRILCDTLRDITLCKIPSRNEDVMYFFLRKEAAL